MADLDEAILKAQAIDVASLHRSGRTKRLNDIGILLRERYTQTNAVFDLENAIRVAREAIDASHLEYHDMTGLWSNLADYLGDRYYRAGNKADLEEAIHALRQALGLIPVDHPSRAKLFNKLGVRLGDKYNRTGAVADLDEAIHLFQQAIDMTSAENSDRAGFLNNLGVRLGDRYAQTKESGDLNQAILIAQQVVAATLRDHPNYSGRLANLGNRLSDRYSLKGDSKDLEEAIRVAKEAVHSSPSSHPDRPAWLNNLGIRLGDRYLQTGNQEDLEEAIRVAEEAVHSSPLNHPDRPAWLSNLGIRLNDRYSRTGNQEDLDKAILVGQKALESTAPDRPRQAILLNNLGSRLGDRYSRTGHLGDLEEAIRMGQQAVHATAPDHPSRAIMLNNLGIHLRERYSRTGNRSDLEEAIRLGFQVVNSTSFKLSDRGVILNNLGNRLGERYSRTGRLADLDEAICIMRQAVEATLIDCPDRPGFLTNLGIRLAERYFRAKGMVDLDEAIAMLQEAVDTTPVNHPNRGGRLTNLGNRLGEKYSQTGKLADLNAAIDIAQQALHGTPTDHPDRAGRLNNLGVRLGDRYCLMGEMADIRDSIDLLEKSVNATPLNHPDRVKRLTNLGVGLSDRYRRTASTVDLEAARTCFTVAFQHPTAIIRDRVLAGRHLLSSPSLVDPLQAYSISKIVVNLIPLLTARSLQNTDKRHLLGAAVGISSDAAAIALHAGESPFAAIELLETGRGIIAGALLERSEVSALERVHLELARSFIELRDQLETLSSETFSAIVERPSIVSESEHVQRRETEVQLTGILQTIRSLPDFERFLLSPSEADILEVASSGPIVILNVSSHRCDALIIKHSGIRLLELPHLSKTAIDERVVNLRSLETLGWLWDNAVCPILDVLGFTRSPSDTQWPHIWWIPTGALTRFPLHAAGHHLRRSGETALDRVISSYSSSVKAIIHGRRRRNSALVIKGSLKAIIVAMKFTPGQEPLKFVAEEIDTVLAIYESMGLLQNQPQPCKDHVLSALDSCSFFHFAGHGNTHPSEPLHSQLLLEDWERDPFTVESFFETNLTLSPPFLAYLSACGTGQIIHEESIDESIHLSSACQLAGFRHVIGTLWSVDDRLSVDMARLTYGLLRDRGMSDESVSYGLHNATKTLRDQWVDSEQDTSVGRLGGFRAKRDAELGDTERKCPHWVPYVHYGT